MARRGAPSAQDAHERSSEVPAAPNALRDHEGGRGLGGDDAGLPREAPHEGLQLVAEPRHGLVAARRVLRDGARDDRLDLRRGRGVQDTDGTRRVADHRPQHLEAPLSAERGLAGEHLVEHDPEAEDVGAVIHRVARGLLGRAVADRPAGDADLGQRLAACGLRVIVLGPIGQHLREAEVQDLGLAGGRHHDVRGLDVAVDDAGRVGDGQGVGDLDGDGQRRKGDEGTAVQQLLERVALDELHHDVDEPVLLAHVVDRADVGVLEGRAQAGLPFEAAAGGLALGELGAQRLDDHRPVEARVLGAVGGGLSALAELPDDPVVRERAAWFQRNHGSRRSVGTLRPSFNSVK